MSVLYLVFMFFGILVYVVLGFFNCGGCKRGVIAFLAFLVLSVLATILLAVAGDQAMPGARTVTFDEFGNAQVEGESIVEKETGSKRVQDADCVISTNNTPKTTGNIQP
jgi:hypothetical protein